MPGASNWLAREISLWQTSAPAWEPDAVRQSRLSTWVAGMLIIGTIALGYAYPRNEVKLPD